MFSKQIGSEGSALELTAVDRIILESYIPVLQGLAEYLSPCFEIVLHSLEDYEHSVICIINGEHTGRQIGAPITDLALQMFEVIEEQGKDSIVYFSKNRNNEPLKSTTIAIRGEKQRVIGLLCINLYLNTSLADIVQSLSPDPASLHAGSLPETFARDTAELVLSALAEEKAKVLNDKQTTPAKRNRMIVEGLSSRGIFQVKNAVNIVAEELGLSKNTIYLHLRALKS